MANYPAWICADCGNRYGRTSITTHIATFHYGTCGWCKRKDVPVTEPRDYGYPRSKDDGQ
jgi:hypothetical protein